MDSNKEDAYKEISELVENVKVIKKMVKYQAENIQKIKTEQDNIKKLLQNVVLRKEDDGTSVVEREEPLDETWNDALIEERADTLKEQSRINYEMSAVDENKYNAQFTIDDDSVGDSKRDVYTDDESDSSPLEFKIGGIWLNRIAIVLIVLSAGYFIKYAFDNNWVTPTSRIVIGIVFGLAFIVWGELLQKTQYASFAQGITGGGLAIIYFSVFAGYYFFRHENIMSQPFAMFLTIITTATSVALSIRYNSKAIALLGLLGGFMAPFVLSGDVVNYEGLFTYLLILNIGILAISYERKWDFLSYISFGLTEFIMLASFSSYFGEIEKMFVVTQLFFTVNFILYLVIPVAYSTFRKTHVHTGNLVVITLNTLLYAFVSYTSINQVIPEYRGVFALMMAVVFTALGTVIRQINPGDNKLISIFNDTAVTFLTLAVPLQLYKYEFMNLIAIGWAIEGVVLLSIGFRHDDSRLRTLARWILTLAVGKHVIFDTWAIEAVPGMNYIPVLNRWFSETLIVTVAALIAGFQYAKNYHKLKENEKAFKDIALMAAVILLCIGMSVEGYRFFELGNVARKNYMAMQLTLSILWAVYSIITIIIGIIKRYTPIRMFAISLFALAIFKAFLYDLSILSGVYRVLSLIVLGFVLLAVSFLYQKYKYIILDDFILEDEDKALEEEEES